MLRFMNVANALSLAGLSAALACALLALNGRLAHALVALVVSGVCDLFDGFVARKLTLTDEEKRFGGHLDSVIDACSFGLAPAVLLYALGLRSPAELVLLAAFASCATWRLAYFDTVGLTAEGGPTLRSAHSPLQGPSGPGKGAPPPSGPPGGLSTEGEARYYTGLPVTFVALVLPLAALSGFAGATPLRVAANVAALGLALAMVSSWKIRKPGGVWYAVLLATAVVLVAAYGGLAADYPAR